MKNKKKKIKIWIDNNEPKSLKSKMTNGGVNFQIYNLPVGDIAFTDNMNKGIVVVERKTLPDLEASMKDGRFDNQIYRLKRIKSMPIYLVEMCGKPRSISLPFLKQRLITISLYHKIHVIRVRDMRGTVEVIKKIYKCLMKYHPIANNKDALKEYGKCMEKTIKRIPTKSSLNRPENYLINALILIPGIGHNCAVSIFKKYSSIPVLYREYIKNINCYDFLSMVVISKNNVRVRRVGDVRARKIIKYLFSERGVN
jgi:ERCC4-type nuclease